MQYRYPMIKTIENKPEILKSLILQSPFASTYILKDCIIFEKPTMKKSLVKTKESTKHTKVSMIEAFVSHVLTHSIILSILDFNSSLSTIILSVLWILFVFLFFKYTYPHMKQTAANPIPFINVVKVIFIR